jgi:transposase-like protein
MAVNRCRLSKKQQRKLLEWFVAEVTARTAGTVVVAGIDGSLPRAPRG